MQNTKLKPVKSIHPITARCKKLGITQKELAEKCHLHQQTISAWCSGRKPINFDNYKLYDMLEVLKLNINSLVGIPKE